MKKAKEKPLNVLNVTLNTAADAFGVDRRTVHRWLDEKAPRNADGSFSLPSLFAWRLLKAESKRETSGSVKEQKTKKEIEFLQSRIDERNGLMMDRALHETILTSRAGSMRTFLEKTAMSNAVHFVGLSIDEARTKLFGLFKMAMDAWTGYE